MENILRLKDMDIIRKIEDKYSNRYKDVNIDTFLDTLSDEQNLIDKLIDKIMSDKSVLVNEDVARNIIELRGLLEKHKQMYLNIDLNFEDANKEDMLFNLSLIHDRILSWIETIDNITIVNNSSQED